MTRREHFLLMLIKLMQKEIECLRSVLSEFDGDKSEYVQMNRADLFKETREALEHEI